MTPGPARVTQGDLEAALWRLLTASDREDASAFRATLDEVEPALVAATDPGWVLWRHVFAARRALLDGNAGTVGEAVVAAREALEKCPSTDGTALAMAYLAHVEVTADRFDSAMLLAIDTSLLTEEHPPAARPTRALLQAHFWLSRTLTGLDLEELAVEHAQRGHGVALLLDHPGDRWRLLLLTAQQHAELAQTLRRRGEIDRARELALTAIDCATAARVLDFTPLPAEQVLLDVVQSWALTCRDELDEALGPMRSAHRRVQADGGIWLRGYADLALARLLVLLAARDGDPTLGEQAIDLLVDASGAFAAAGDRRRYRLCLLELGQATAALGRPAEALHWLEAYRADTGRAHARGLELWAEMFVRRSRLREAERQAALLQRHALEDPLTGLGNRRSAETRLGRLQLSETPVSLAVVDVDRFKEVNDEASHLSGDAVLKRVADLLREHSRAADEVYRWAGDEFLVVLPTASEEQAVVVMDRLRAAVAGADWSDLPLTAPVTVSVGVATAASLDGDGAGPVGWKALFDTADLHLFSAKRGGRNRVRARGGMLPGASPTDGTADPQDSA